MDSPPYPPMPFEDINLYKVLCSEADRSERDKMICDFLITKELYSFDLFHYHHQQLKLAEQMKDPGAALIHEALAESAKLNHKFLKITRADWMQSRHYQRTQLLPIVESKGDDSLPCDADRVLDFTSIGGTSQGCEGGSSPAKDIVDLTKTDSEIESKNGSVTSGDDGDISDDVKRHDEPDKVGSLTSHNESSMCNGGAAASPVATVEIQTKDAATSTPVFEGDNATYSSVQIESYERASRDDHDYSFNHYLDADSGSIDSSYDDRVLEDNNYVQNEHPNRNDIASDSHAHFEQLKSRKNAASYDDDGDHNPCDSLPSRKFDVVCNKCLQVKRFLVIMQTECLCGTLKKHRKDKS